MSPGSCYLCVLKREKKITFTFASTRPSSGRGSEHAFMWLTIRGACESDNYINATYRALLNSTKEEQCKDGTRTWKRTQTDKGRLSSEEGMWGLYGITFLRNYSCVSVCIYNIHIFIVIYT